MISGPGFRVHAIIVTSCNGNNDEMSYATYSYIVEQPPTCPFKS